MSFILFYSSLSDHQNAIKVELKQNDRIREKNYTWKCIIIQLFVKDLVILQLHCSPFLQKLNLQFSYYHRLRPVSYHPLVLERNSTVLEKNGIYSKCKYKVNCLFVCSNSVAICLIESILLIV